MLFSSLIFLYGFLPLFFAAYFGAPGRFRNAVLIAFSVAFYAWGEPIFLGILLPASGLLFQLGKHLHPNSGYTPEHRKILLIGGLSIALGLLAYFKYANFLARGLWGIFGIQNNDTSSWIPFALPLGISFFTFQKVSYLVDVYRGTSKPAARFSDFILYVLLFPQLIAGPIVRYHEVEGSLADRETTIERIKSGLLRFTLGLASKTLLANPLGQTADRIFALPAESLNTSTAWLGLLTYSLQIYFDFSGYSSMAVGLARMLGFDFPENFDHPYRATSVTDFWKRWHKSLSTFMRDYLYIPLGGNKRGDLLTLRNLWVVFLLSGLWHGANWTFVAWGAYHGALLSAERGLRFLKHPRLHGVFAIPSTFLLVGIGWVLFRSDSFGQAKDFLLHLLPHEPAAPSYAAMTATLLPLRTLIALLVASLLAFTPANRVASRVPQTWRFAAAAAGFLLSTASLASQSYNPFIYFRF